MLLSIVAGDERKAVFCLGIFTYAVAVRKSEKRRLGNSCVMSRDREVPRCQASGFEVMTYTKK